MCDEWMSVIKLPMTIDQFHRLPRNPAYKYEYLDGMAWLSPRPKYYRALLDLDVRTAPLEGAHRTVVVRPLVESDWEDLEGPFAGAFRSRPPFSELDDEPRLQAARKALAFTRNGGDGPWVERASFVAASADGERPLGALLVTLLPLADLTDWDSYHWPEPPPPDAIERRLGRPHLTWIFVSPLHSGQGIGTALLAATVQALRDLGFTELASTFMLGNDSSMLWHWRCGFRLLPYPGSYRRRS